MLRNPILMYLLFLVLHFTIREQQSSINGVGTGFPHLYIEDPKKGSGFPCALHPADALDQ
jgi:hypothetical protein